MSRNFEFVSRFFEGPLQSYFLFGPRGTGKSTWIQNQYPNAVIIDLLKPDKLQTYLASPERLEAVVQSGQTDIYVIDEIQKIPRLLSMVHYLIEKYPIKTFILTGSSARKLKRSGVDLLAGRAIQCHFHPFMASELGHLFNLEFSLQYGLLPLIYQTKYPLDALKTYISLYLREEVQMEGLVRQIGTFSKFLEVMSFSHASILNMSNIARECMVNQKLIESYIGILEDLMIAFRLPVFTKRAKRASAVHPKFYFFDTGVFRQLRPKGPIDSYQELDGLALEGLVGQHLRAWIDYSRRDIKLYFWRTRAGSEVDFILYGENCFYAIEVKNSVKIHPQQLNSLEAFYTDYPESTPVLLYRGDEQIKIKSVLCIPVETFLKQLNPRSNPVF